MSKRGGNNTLPAVFMHSAWGQALTAFSCQTFLFLIILEIYPPNRRVYFSMSQLAMVRFAERIDRFVKGQVTVGEWCALIASGASSRPICLVVTWGLRLRTQNCGAGKEPDGKCDLVMACRVPPSSLFVWVCLLMGECISLCVLLGTATLTINNETPLVWVWVSPGVV